MARPQAADYDERREQILDTAASIFADGGYHKASVSGVAKAAGISKSLIYHYYPSKQDMLYHAMVDHVRELEKAAHEIMAEKLEAKIALGKIIRRYLKLYETTVDRHHLLINELDNLTPEQKAEVVAIQNNVVKAFATLADDLTPAKLDNHKAKTAVSMLMLGMINWTYIWFKPGGPVNSDHLSNIIEKMFLDGLANIDDSVFE